MTDTCHSPNQQNMIDTCHSPNNQNMIDTCRSRDQQIMIDTCYSPNHQDMIDTCHSSNQKTMIVTCHSSNHQDMIDSCHSLAFLLHSPLFFCSFCSCFSVFCVMSRSRISSIFNSAEIPKFRFSVLSIENVICGSFIALQWQIVKLCETYQYITRGFQSNS